MRKPHCLILPYPSQGHINPMLQFSKRLAHKGIQITFAATKYIAKTTFSLHHNLPGSISIETISDGYDDEGYTFGTSLDTYLDKFQKVGTQTLFELLDNLNMSGRPVDCLIYDPFLLWGLAVAKRFGILAAAFFTQSCCVNNIYYNIFKGHLKVPISEREMISLPGLPLTLEISDMPSFVSDQKAFQGALRLVVDQFSGIEGADFVFVNSVYELEQEVTDWMAKLMPVKTIGPTIPSMYLDKRLPEDKTYNLSIFEKANSCAEWLDQKPSQSVIYIAFGSMAEFEVEQMQEFAMALKATGKYFLWAVRSSEEHKLPNDFLNDSSLKGLIVSWVPQLEVLAHDAISCFITHCGWNSVLEALCAGVPMVGIPWWSDQSTNARLVMDLWKVGVQARADGKNIVRKQEIVECVKCIIEGDGGEEMRRNAEKWKELARSAMKEEGSSDRNIHEFVSTLMLRGLASS